MEIQQISIVYSGDVLCLKYLWCCSSHECFYLSCWIVFTDSKI